MSKFLELYRVLKEMLNSKCIWHIAKSDFNFNKIKKNYLFFYKAEWLKS